MINREKILKAYRPKLSSFDFESPLPIGNGELGFYADITGMQSFNDMYTKKNVPLCTMSQWGWHSTPVSKERRKYTLDDLEMTTYKFNGRDVRYPVQPKEGNEIVYDWLRKNPHRINLMQIGFKEKQQSLNFHDISDVFQELKIDLGVLESCFSYRGERIIVQSICDSESDTLSFCIESNSFLKGELNVNLEFPYPTPDISASDWSVEKKSHHRTTLVKKTEYKYIIERKIDDMTYYVTIEVKNAKVCQIATHEIEIIPCSEKIEVLLYFSKDSPQEIDRGYGHADILKRTQQHWINFWKEVGFVDFTESTNEQAGELQRRILLSHYLLKIQSTGSMPPQETGLMCNSWYGKFHLEMHLWHAAYLPLYNQPELLLESIKWYTDHMTEAKKNASINGYKGLRWPKMVGPEGIDSPSYIAPLLIWQQSHIIYMLELINKAIDEEQFIADYWPLVEGTADFMCDFLQCNLAKNQYDLMPPIIPSQEEFDPTSVINPTFELSYWKFCLKLALTWAKKKGIEKKDWQDKYDKIAVPIPLNELYLSYENCEETFKLFNKDHPAMLGILGLIPNEEIDFSAFKKTIDKVYQTWNFDTMWGWDFGMMSMAATRVGNPDLAMKILLMDTNKNQYVVSGNNYQRLRTDLPSYLPGNGSLLLTIALMVAGYPNSEELPGIPKDGSWQVSYENIMAFPY